MTTHKQDFSDDQEDQPVSTCFTTIKPHAITVLWCSTHPSLQYVVNTSSPSGTNHLQHEEAATQAGKLFSEYIP